jgi:diamine N-acetyltransferase
MMEAQIIPVFTKAEIDIVAGLAKIIWPEHYVPIIGQEQVDYMVAKFQSPEAIENQVRNEGYSYFIITSSGQPVGYIGIIEKTNELFLSKIYILSDERGKGFGQCGINFLTAQCRNKGLGYITLTVNKYNLRSISAYEKMGFEKYGEVVGDIGSGYVMDDYLMRKRIYPE